MTTLFIADLHLHEERPEITRAFLHFLKNSAPTAEALYILGDFFDAWIGDDDDAPLITEIADALIRLTCNGTQLFLMHGNRDFLLGQEFANKVGAQLMPEGTIIDLYGCPTLLLHGDSLCTLDHAYQAFRQHVRTPEWQAQILTQPLAARRILAQQIRTESKSMNSLKAEDIMDVTPAEVVRVMSEAKVLRLIHGHTHRPARHLLRVNQQDAERIVLGDWHTQAWCLTASPESLVLQHWDIPH